MTAEFRRPQPVLDNSINEYFFRSGGQQVELRFCDDCQRWIFYPRVACPSCLSLDSLRWKPVSGRGVITSYTKVYRSQHPAFDTSDPLWLLAVELEEGPVILVNGDDMLDSPQIGNEVELVKIDIGEGVSIPLATAPH